ncbi:MAG: sulfatase-like hydrolase/transferase, partial [Thermomicrobiales bacterium]
MPRPNILIVLTDQQQGAMLGCAGAAGLHTPAMDRLATTGTRFDRAFCTTPQCSASRASLMTGLYPHRHGVLSNIPDTTFGPRQLPQYLPSVGQILHDASYHTAYFGKWHLGAAGEATSNPLAYGFDHFVPPPGHAEQEGEGDLAMEAASYLAEYTGAQPLLLVASFNDPHGVYALRRITRPLETDGITLPASFDDDLATKPAAQRTYRDEDQPAALPLDEATARRYVAWYAYMVERADGYLARLLTALDSRPALAANTVVVFASDHGDLACAHRLPFKGPCMYEELVRVPLLVQGPGIARGAMRSELVTLADLLPTLCDLAQATTPAGLDGQSLLPLLHGATPPWRDAVIGQYHGKQRWFCPIRMVRTATQKFTLYTTGERELYDLAADPAERHNRAGDPGYAAIERDLAGRLAAWMETEGDPFPHFRATDREGR